jgi:uncharacterized protein YraI
MKRWTAYAVALAALAGSPAMAADDGSYSADRTPLLSSPDPHSASLRMVAAGTALNVQGCTKDYAWCSVVADKDRGWMPGSHIQYRRDSERLLLSSHGVAIGVPIVTFSIPANNGSFGSAASRTPARARSMPTRTGH